MKGGSPPAAAEKEQGLYEIRRKVYPRAVTGPFARWRWSVVWLTQVVFYGVPWLTWSGRQAVLFDLAQRKFYIFGLVFWPQDVVYLTALLIICAYSLFLFTAVAGRLWCGYACPQTVYTEMFLWIERLVEGDRSARMRLDAGPSGGRKFALKASKHGLWITLAAYTGFTFVGYFTPIRVLVSEVAALQLGPWETFWIVFYSVATYGNAGWMREQVCKYMCPYARFQGVMFDPDTLIISYDVARGEPRGARARTADYRAKGFGDCVDCSICVQVCPTGIDIRNGLQLECIGCGGCVDACNQVMAKMGYPAGLVRYTTDNALRQGLPAAAIARRVARPRTLIYSAILLAIVTATATSLSLRKPLKANVLRDRGNVGTGSASAENVYRLKLMNTQEQAADVTFAVRGLPGVEYAAEGQPIRLSPLGERVVPVRVKAPVGDRHGPAVIEFDIRARSDDGRQIELLESARFVFP